jgi:rRNA biogenesis protein RRP5
MGIQPLALVLSLPNQLAGHVPITQISPELTQVLEAMDVDSAEEEPSDTPELHDLFQPGQYVRCIVTAVHAAGTTEGSIIRRSKDDLERTSWRVELSLSPEQVNEGVSKTDLKSGFVSSIVDFITYVLTNNVCCKTQSLSASVKSIEDHGYILNVGVPEVASFLSFKDAKKRFGDSKLRVGKLLDVVVSKLSSNGRTCNVTVAEDTLKTASV